MRYHQITTDDMNNGEGLRTVLWVAGCNHHCPNCHNQFTWDENGGLLLDINTIHEIEENLSKDYISGLTLSGGDPFYISNRKEIAEILFYFKSHYYHKSIWLYTGYTWEEIMVENSMKKSLPFIDVLVDGEFKQELADVNYHWAGSTNQRVIDVQKSLDEGSVILYENH